MPIGSGNIEQRINRILQKCRSQEDIEAEFNDLQDELDDFIKEKEKKTRTKLLEHFDEEVAARLKTHREEFQLAFEERGCKIRALCYGLLPNATHDEDGFKHEGELYFYDWRRAEKLNGHFLNVEKFMGLDLEEKLKQISLESTKIIFNYKSYGRKLSGLLKMRGRSGWLRLTKLKIDSIDAVEKLVFSAHTDDGVVLDQHQCEHLMLIPAEQGGLVRVSDVTVQKIQQAEQYATNKHLEDFQCQNKQYFDEEQEKLDRWAEDSKEAIDLELKSLEKEIREAKKAARTKKLLEEKVIALRHAAKLEKEHDDKKMKYFETRKLVDEQSDMLLDEVLTKLELSHKVEEIFTIRWKINLRVVT